MPSFSRYCTLVLFTRPMNFTKKNTLTGWFVFFIAFTTYYLTVEPTASYWDCSEYIATSAKLQVGHPPGAPLFQMMGAFFSSFASGPENVAFWVNMMSVMASAFTILFMFWSLTRIITRFVIKDENPKGPNETLVLGAAAVGALSYAFSDSFWFNAVEAEVYAMAMFITSVMFWLGLRWEEEMHTPRGDRWLVLIAFLIGLSFGVHFMGLLTVPAIGMLYYFRNYTFSWKSFVIANVVSIAVLLFVFKLLLPLTLAYFGNAEVFFVNSFGLPFNSGTIIAGLSIIAFFIWGLRFTQQKKWVQQHRTLVHCLYTHRLFFMDHAAHSCQCQYRYKRKRTCRCPILIGLLQFRAVSRNPFVLRPYVY